MLLVMGLRAEVFEGREMVRELYPDNLLLDIADYTDPENLDEILTALANEWFNDPDRRNELAKMVKIKNADFYIINIMFGGKIYSYDDPIYKSIFDSIGIIYRT